MRRFFLVLITALFVMGADDCDPSIDPPPSPTDPGFCAGVTSGVVESTVRGVEGELMSIVGGFEASDYMSTVQVWIQSANGAWGYCSGVVLSPHTVIAAGHCKSEIDSYIVYQDRYKGDKHSWIPGASLQHPGYARWNNTFCKTDIDTGQPCTGTSDDGCYVMRCPPHDDLLLLYFKDALPIKPVDGIYSSQMSTHCTDLIAQGWGATTRAGVVFPEGYEAVDCRDGAPYCLQQAPIEVIHVRPSAYDLWVRGWGDKCFGDSGGPTYAIVDDGRVLLAGITSTVTNINCVGTEQVRAHSTDVKASYYASWIMENIKP